MKNALTSGHNDDDRSGLNRLPLSHSHYHDGNKRRIRIARFLNQSKAKKMDMQSGAVQKAYECVRRTVRSKQLERKHLNNQRALHALFLKASQ